MFIIAIAGIVNGILAIIELINLFSPSSEINIAALILYVINAIVNFSILKLSTKIEDLEQKVNSLQTQGNSSRQDIAKLESKSAKHEARIKHLNDLIEKDGK